jgi:putative ABC transport system permease protein
MFMTRLSGSRRLQGQRKQVPRSQRRLTSADSRYGMPAPAMLLIFSIRNMLRTPFRLFLVVILLGTSLMFVAAMAALNSSAHARLAVIDSQVGTGIDVASGIGVQRPVTIAELRRAEQTPGVARFTERLFVGLSETQPHSTFVTGARLRPQTFLVYGSSDGNDIFAKGDTLVRRTAGRTFRPAELDANVALIGVGLARSNHLHLGSAVALDGVHLRLIGLYTTGSSFGDNSIALPIGTAERIPFFDGKSIWVTVYAPTAEAVPSLAAALHHRLGPAVSVTTHQTGISGALTALLGLEKSSTSSLLLALGAAFVITMATVVLTIRERITEIGLLKAIGASDLQVIQQFAIENVISSLMAAAAGAILLTVAGRTIAQAFDVTAAAGGHSQLSVGLTPHTALALAGAGTGLAIFASALPAWHIARLKPAQVLRAS